MAFDLELPVSKKKVTWDFVTHGQRMALAKSFKDEDELISKTALYALRTVDNVQVKAETYAADFENWSSVDAEFLAKEYFRKKVEVLNPTSPLDKK